MAVVLAVTVAVGAVGTAIAARHRAQAGADLSALAGAAAVAAGADTACARADRVARAMHGALIGCRLDGLDLVVTVEVSVRMGRWAVGQARAAARAGP